ncbi:unnamed protein product [Umbelopsis vinacea]
MSSSAADWEYPEHRQFERVPSLDQVDQNDRKDQNCRDLADMYLKAAKENKVEGFRKKPTTEA